MSLALRGLPRYLMNKKNKMEGKKRRHYLPFELLFIFQSPSYNAHSSRKLFLPTQAETYYHILGFLALFQSRP